MTYLERKRRWNGQQSMKALYISSAVEELRDQLCYVREVVSSCFLSLRAEVSFTLHALASHHHFHFSYSILFSMHSIFLMLIYT